MKWKSSLISNAWTCNNWHDIKDNCKAFSQHYGFRHFFILGSIFDNYATPYTQVLSNYCDTTRLRFSSHIHTMLAEIIEHSLVSGTPLIRGQSKRYKYHARQTLPGIKHISKFDAHSSINFPVHFPSGRFALLHFGTYSNQQTNYRHMLTQGYQFSLAVCSSFLKLIEKPLQEVPLSERERYCLKLACDGINPKQASSQLGLSIHTIQYHLKTARRKLHAKNLQQTLSYALNQGEISPDLEFVESLPITNCDLA